MADSSESLLPTHEIKAALQNNNVAAAAAKIQKFLDEQKNIPLNIGITGESGSGKSTFVNAIRGINVDDDERAAPTDCVETTTVPKPYPHPNLPNVQFWDLPGVGTMKFPADKYLQEVGFEKYDFFIIISADRFTENDVKLAQEIQKMKKKFYYVRSKIDHNVRDEERRKKFNLKETLDRIRQNCTEGLQKQGFEDPQVFLVSSFELHKFDFHQLQETLQRELPAHKRNACLMAMPNISRGIIDKKKQALHSKIKYIASLSALIASAPVPGLSITVDVSMLVSAVIEYQTTFGLDKMSLQSLADSAKMSLNDLRSVMKSPLAAEEIDKDFIIKTLTFSVSQAALMAAEEGSRFIPLIGIPVAMSLSFLSTYRTLSTVLNMFSDDAQSVFTRALGLET